MAEDDGGYQFRLSRIQMALLGGGILMILAIVLGLGYILGSQEIGLDSARLARSRVDVDLTRPAKAAPAKKREGSKIDAPPVGEKTEPIAPADAAGAAPESEAETEALARAADLKAGPSAVSAEKAGLPTPPPAGEAKPLKEERQIVGATAPSAVAPKAPASLSEASPSSDTAEKGPQAGSAGDYTVQIGSFDARNQASDMIDRFKKKGYPVYMLEKVVPRRGTVYRVRVGRFTTMEAAQRYARDFEGRERIRPWVTRVE